MAKLVLLVALLICSAFGFKSDYVSEVKSEAVWYLTKEGFSVDIVEEVIEVCYRQKYKVLDKYVENTYFGAVNNHITNNKDFNDFSDILYSQLAHNDENAVIDIILKNCNDIDRYAELVDKIEMVTRNTKANDRLMNNIIDDRFITYDMFKVRLAMLINADLVTYYLKARVKKEVR